MSVTKAQAVSGFNAWGNYQNFKTNFAKNVAGNSEYFTNLDSYWTAGYNTADFYPKEVLCYCNQNFHNSLFEDFEFTEKNKLLTQKICSLTGRYSVPSENWVDPTIFVGAILSASRLIVKTIDMQISEHCTYANENQLFHNKTLKLSIYVFMSMCLAPIIMNSAFLDSFSGYGNFDFWTPEWYWIVGRQIFNNLLTESVTIWIIPIIENPAYFLFVWGWGCRCRRKNFHITTKQFVSITKVPEIDIIDTYAQFQGLFMIDLVMVPVMPVILLASAVQMLSIIARNWVYGKFFFTRPFVAHDN